MIRLEFGSGNLTKEIRINPRRSCINLLARIRSVLSKGPFTLRGRSGEESEWYLQLQKQEIQMWAMCPEHFSQGDFDVICQVRGFTTEEAQSMLDALRWMGYRFKAHVNPEKCKVLE